MDALAGRPQQQRDAEATAAGHLIKTAQDKDVTAFRNYTDSKQHERVSGCVASGESVGLFVVGCRPWVGGYMASTRCRVRRRAVVWSCAAQQRGGTDLSQSTHCPP